MAAASQGRRRRHFDAWPGYVDVLSTLLMVVIFVLMVFVIAQLFLSEALSGRDEALERLNRQLAEIFPGARVTVARYVYLLQAAVPLDEAGHQRLAQVLGYELKPVA